MSLPRHLITVGAVLTLIVAAVVTRVSAPTTEVSGAFTVAFGPATNAEARTGGAPTMREQELLRDLAFTPWVFATPAISGQDNLGGAAWTAFTSDQLLTLAQTPWDLVGGFSPATREPIPTGPTFTHEYLTLIFFPWDALAAASLN